MTEAAVTWKSGALALRWRVSGARVDSMSASPQLALELEVDSPAEVEVRALLLRAQVRIAVRRRGYDPATRERLFELFGDPADWKRNLRDLSWAQATIAVPPFSGTAQVTVPLPCSYDFEVGTAKYLYALPDGVVPLDLILSGTVFYAGDDDELRTTMLVEANDLRYDLDSSLIRRAMERFFPGSVWIRIARDTFDRLWDVRSRRALPTWDHALDHLLDREPEEEPA